MSATRFASRCSALKPSPAVLARSRCRTPSDRLACSCARSFALLAASWPSFEASHTFAQTTANARQSRILPPRLFLQPAAAAEW
ncbi:MAG: hypothetical protein PHS14_11740 [Elusimicrobia bacterium]|nr:hypothetical protein [Elusimicrobiota bacterium]